ncbi:recombinase [Streptomyces sp. CB01881]|nr:recombinase [Streptomyces sp. CB01881]TYC77814.1 recombinase [Streptomyces sp. CB01881]
MPHRATPRRTGHLLPLAAADALWAELMANSVFPAAGQAFTGFPADPRVGYVLLGARAVPTVKGVGGRWHVQEADVRRAAEELRAVKACGVGLVRVAPFRGSLKTGQREGPALRWRQRLGQEWARARVDAAPGPLPRGSDHLPHLAGIDWRRSLMERTGAGAGDTWWLPRTLVKMLDAAEHAEERWLLAARTCQRCGAVADQLEQWRVQAGSSRQTICPDCRTTTPRPYNGELEGHVYSVLSKKRASLEVSGWRCAVCREAPAFAVDHCHEHGYVRAPVCQSCNTRERPNYLYSNDVYVTSRYASLFHTHAEDWLPHWHRCPGCRARTTLPLPHLAALTALLVGEPLRPTHRAPHSSRGRKPCGELRASWTGSHNAPGSCMITLSVDYCPSGEHRILAQVPYREAVDRFRTWLAETAPAVAAAAGPGRHDTVPAQFRPVVPDTSSEGLALF